jgi:hypothetical protein
MITGVCRRVGPGFRFKANLFPPIIPDPSKPAREDVGRMVQTYARFVEDCIREHPEDYLWLHRRWRTPRDGDELMRDDGTYVRHATFEQGRSKSKRKHDPGDPSPELKGPSRS